MPETVTRIGPCSLTSNDGGEWVKATAEEFDRVIKERGGFSNLTVWSGFTNLERSDRGEPYIFTEWGDADAPVAACGVDPTEDRPGVAERCKGEHAIFIPRPS